VHLLDNYVTHKTPEVKTLMDIHPRITLHFTPTSALWLNPLEQIFAEITARRIRQRSCSKVDDLEAGIYNCLLFQNAKPKPFVWSQTFETLSPWKAAP
jgi:transposase